MKLPKIIQALGLAFILLAFLAFLNPTVSYAQTCSGSFTCCEEVDANNSCISIAGPFGCGGASSNFCTTAFPENFCSSDPYLFVFSNGCNWSAPPGSPPPGSPPPGPGPEPVPGEPFPEPYVPCVRETIGPIVTDQAVRFPEFHTFRPYQASPCNEEAEDLALFCGNDLIIGDPRTITKIFVPRIIPIPRYEGSYEYEGNPIGVACFRDADCDTGSTCGPDMRCSPSNCSDNGDGTESCWFNIERTRSLAINLEGAFLPIMGFTEPSSGSESRPNRVINSILQDETMDDATKVNEYVSWYLNGVTNNPAEYGPLDAIPNCIGETTSRAGVCRLGVFGACVRSILPPVIGMSDGQSNCTYARSCCVSNDPSEPTVDILDRDKIINYSGVLRKLLSHRNQRDVIGGDAGLGDRLWDDEPYDGTIVRGHDTRFDGAYIDDINLRRHDQVVGCVYDLSLSNILDGTAGEITDCYREGGRAKPSVNPIRLSQYVISCLLPNDCHYLPPREEDYPDFKTWWLEYKKWRGFTCARLFGVSLCLDNPLMPNYWADLFSHIPMSSTEDRKGLVEIASYTVQPPISSVFVILSSSITNQEPAELFFPHMQESSELGRLLQMTFNPQEGPIDEPSMGAVPVTAPFCDLRAVRSNPGDNLFPGEITADVNYNAMLSCTFIEEGSGIAGDPYNGNLCRFFTGADCIPDVPGDYECAEFYGRFDCDPGFDCARDCNPLPTGETCDIAFPARCVPGDWSCGTEVTIPGICSGGRRCCQGYGRNKDSLPSPLAQDCIVPVQIALNTITETPLADDVWARLVSGPGGVFRHIFPKIEEGESRPIERLWDIPAVTSVVYSGEGVTVAGNPATGRPADQAELYFPHIGGIHEYFLNCIQKTLRPQGFGEGCVSGPEPLVLTPGVCTGDSPPHEGPLPSGGYECQPAVAGWCSESTLRNYFPSSATATDIRNASIVCAGESGGWSNAFNDGCLCGKSCDYSIGLFQMNLLAHCAGASAFDFDCDTDTCAITDEGLVNSCREIMFDPVQNIQAAVDLWERAGRRFGRDWAVAKGCGIP